MCVMFVHFFRAIFLACFLYIDMISCPGYNVNSLQRTLSLCGNFIYKQNLLCRDADLSPFRSCHGDQTPIILVLSPYRCTILCLAISPKLLILAGTCTHTWPCVVTHNFCWHLSKWIAIVLMYSLYNEIFCVHLLSAESIPMWWRFKNL